MAASVAPPWALELPVLQPTEGNKHSSTENFKPRTFNLHVALKKKPPVIIFDKYLLHFQVYRESVILFSSSKKKHTITRYVFLAT